jgi:uncharacterized membrane protein YebE (DUF533 family)
MNPEFLVNGVLRSVLGGRRKRSGRAVRYLTRDLTRGTGGFLSRPSTLLGALGLAWGIFETLNQNQNQPVAAGSSGAPLQEVPVPPLPNVSAPVAVSPDAMRMMRLAVSAAHADGPMNEQEKAAILLQAKQAGVESVFGPEMTQPRPLAEIVVGVTDPAERATLYVLAYTVLRADEQVTGAERIYLAQLANLLGLDPATVAKLETDTGQRIDALGDQGQLGG